MAVVGNAFIEIHAITAGFKNEVERALKDLEPLMRKLGQQGGESLGDALHGGLNKSGGFNRVKQEALAAKDAFNKLIKTGYVMGPVIAGIANAIGDLIFGLGAMVSAIGSAAPAAAALGGSLAALLQGAITAKLAFGGISKAVGAINKGGGAGNDKAIEDARRRLALTYQRTADTMAAANDKVREAQEALNAAYIEGQESLQQLGFDAKDAALAQRRAAIELERARETLMRSQDLAPDSRARREAVIAFEEAENNYRKATDRANDLAAQQEYAARTEIEGTREVIEAKKNLAQAEADRAKTERDNNQDIAEARRALQDALTKSSSQMTDAMKDLSEEAKHFAKYIAGLKPVLNDLREAAGKKLFGPLETAIQNLVDNLVPVLKPILEATGEVLGNIAVAISKVFTSADNLDIFKRIFGGANLTVLQNFGTAFANILDVVLKVLDAVSPLTIRFSEWVKTITDGWKSSMNAEGAVGRLTDKFNAAGDIAATLGSVLKKTWDALKAFFGPSVGVGVKLWESFGRAMDGLKAFGEAGKASGETQKKFEQIGKNLEAIGGALAIVIEGLYEMAGSEGTEVFVNGIKPALRILVEIGKQLTGVGIAKAMSNLIVQVAKLLQKFTESGGIENFFNTLGKGVEILNAIFGNKIVMQIFTTMAAIHGTTLALGFMGDKVSFLAKVYQGKIHSVIDMSKKLGSVSTKTWDVIKPSSWFNAIKVGGQKMGTATKDMFNSFRYLKQGWKEAATVGSSALAPAMTNIGAIGKGLATRDMVTVRAAFQALIAPARAAGAAVMTAVGPFVLIAAAITAVVVILALAYQNSEKLREAVSKMVEILTGSLQAAWEDIQEALGDAGIKVESIQDIFQKLGDWLATYLMPAITIIFDGLIRYIGGIIAGAIKIVKGIWNYFEGIVEFFKAIWSLVTGDFDGFKEHMLGAFGKFVEAAGSIISGIASPFIAAWNGIADGWNKTIGGMEITVPDWVPVIGGNKYNLPFLPKIGEQVKMQGKKITYTGVGGKSGGRMAAGSLGGLATGGIVSPRAGGVHAILAEAGRSERVEPLDPDGMSKRDKAMIDYLTGGAGGGHTFNVYPAQGMSEPELARAVSRQVAWQTRRGA